MISSNFLKTLLLTEYDMDLVGIASAALLENEPVGHRPEDLLPGARSIIVFGRKMIDGALQASFRADEEGLKCAKAGYKTYTQEMSPIFLLMNDTNDIALKIEDMYNGVAVPLTFATQQNMVWDKYPAPLFTDPYGQGMPLDIFKAAMAAGLGEIGWSNRFMTKKYGPRQNLSAILTDIPFSCDRAYDGEPLCDPQNCGICADLCPTGAIPKYGTGNKHKTVVGKTVQVADLNVNACVVASMALRKEFQAATPVPDIVMTNNPTDEELMEAFSRKPIDNGQGLAHYPSYFCDKCLTYCPVGNWKELFYDTGCSTFDGHGFRNHKTFGADVQGFTSSYSEVASISRKER